MIAQWLYSLAIFCYGAAIRLASFFNPKAKLFIQGRKGLLSKISNALKNESRPRIWMHCASLGEFEQGRPVIEAIKANYPNYAIVLTFFSPSGYEQQKNYSGADHVFYLPLDTPSNAARFIDTVKPAFCIFVKYELWFHFLSAVRQRKIPVILISAYFRKDQAFFKWYGGLQRSMLHIFSHIFVQDTNSKELLQKLGVANVTVSGDTRFDRVVAAAENSVELPVAKAFCNTNKVIVAGSTWKEDEQFLEKAMAVLPADWKLILVPHEVHESHIEQIEKLFAAQTIRWSAYDENTKARILVVDKIGLLLHLYPYGHFAWIGGGFGSEGVHNVLEAAVYGVPCAYGPIFHQFAEAEELIASGGAITTSDPKALATKLMSLETDMNEYAKEVNAAKNYVRSKAGATEKIMDHQVLKNALSRP